MWICGSLALGFSQTIRTAPLPAAPEIKSRIEHLRFALSHEGNPLRGKDLFSTEERLACSKCHAVDGKGGKAGPDLFAIGDKYGRREIIESVLTPSAIIAEGYGTTTVETKSGRVSRQPEATGELGEGPSRDAQYHSSALASHRLATVPQG